MPIEHNDLIPLGSLELLARGIVEGFLTGLHKSPFHGFSVEFAEHRHYNTGESTRHIDWKLYAKTDRLYVKKFEDETNLRCRIVIDCSSSMCFNNKLKFVVECAASIIELLRRQHDAIGLDLFDNHVVTHTEEKTSSAHIRNIYSLLEKLLKSYDKNDKHTTAATTCLHQIAEMTHKRSLVILFSDLFDAAPQHDVFSAIDHLHFNGNEVILFNVHDEKLEQQLLFEDRPHRFIDLENGDVIKLNPADVRADYEKIMAEKKQNLINKCRQSKIDYVEADINEGYGKILTEYLVKRSKI